MKTNSLLTSKRNNKFIYTFFWKIQQSLKIPEMLGFDGEYLVDQAKGNF